MKKSLKILGVGVGAGILIVGMLASNMMFTNIASALLITPVNHNSGNAGNSGSNNNSSTPSATTPITYPQNFPAEFADPNYSFSIISKIGACDIDVDNLIINNNSINDAPNPALYAGQYSGEEPATRTCTITTVATPATWYGPSITIVETSTLRPAIWEGFENYEPSPGFGQTYGYYSVLVNPDGSYTEPPEVVQAPLGVYLAPIYSVTNIPAIAKTTYNPTTLPPPPTLPSGPGIAATGTINVTSENSVTDDPVNAMWAVLASDPSIPGMNVCEFEGVAIGSDELCSGTSGVYENIPADGDPVQISPSSTSAGTLYVLGGVEERPAIAAKNSNPLDELFTFSKNLLTDVANAQTICSYTGTPGQPCPSNDLNVPSQTLNNPGDNANFTILWSPVAVMNVAPTAVSLDTVNNTLATTTVSNTGAPGSTLDWNAATTYDANGSGWLSINGGSDQASGSVAAGDSSVVNFTANTGNLAAGTYQAMVMFTNINGNTPYPVSVTLTVASGTNSCPDCTSTSTPSSSNPGSSTSTNSGDATNTNPGNPTSTPPGGSTPSCNLAATPSSIAPGQSSKISYSCSNVSSCSLSPWVNGQLAPGGTYSYGGASGSESVRPTTNTTYELNCDSGAVYESATVTVTNPGLNETNP